MENLIENEMERAAKQLKIAEDNGLLIEVVVWALNEMSNNPKLTVNQALNYGLLEWDC